MLGPHHQMYGRKRCLTLALLGLALAATAVLAQSTSFPIYKQEEAVRAARSKEVLGHMNLSADPCEDFYEYICGNWNKLHVVTGKASEAESPQVLLDDKVNKDLHRLLDDNVTVDDTSTHRKLKTFYKSCLDARRDEEQHQLFLNDFVKNNGGFPAVPGSNWLVHHHNYDWQHVVAGLRYDYGLEILVGIDIDINYQNIYENSIYLTEPPTLIPQHLCSQAGTQRVEVTDHIYDAVEREVADNLRQWLSLKKQDALAYAADIVTFEYDLCAGMYVNETEEEFIGSLSPEQLTPKYERKSLVELTRQFNNSIDFNALLRESFGVSINKPVFMKSPHYFQHLAKVIDEYEETNKSIIANYVMYMALNHINLPLNDTPLNRPLYCLKVMKQYFPSALGDMFHQKYANTAYQTDVQNIFEKLKYSFDAALSQPWIEEGTGRLGKYKLSELLLQFPANEKRPIRLDFVRTDYWRNLKLAMAVVRDYDVNRAFKTGLPAPKDELQAYDTRVIYRPHHKRIDVGWGLLQAPYYYEHLPSAIRYALIGQRLAEALAIAFDDFGWMADTTGLSNWDPSTAVEYYKRANCFREQMGNYLNNDPFSFRNASQTRRIIARSSGLNVAFNAYLDWLRYKHPINDQTTLYKETLPELNFSNTQLFFITFGQMHCRSRRKMAYKSPDPGFPLSALQRHSMRRYEINGPLGNFKEFAREFRCAVGTEMNPADVCVIY